MIATLPCTTSPIDLGDRRRRRGSGRVLFMYATLALEDLAEPACHLAAARVRRDGDDAVAREALVAEVLREERQRRHVVDRDGEEPLDLARVQVHREHAVDPGHLRGSSATSFAVIGSRGADFLSWREYGYQGMTAVIRFAEASFAASIMHQELHQSWSFGLGAGADWTMKTSAPRIDSR